MDVLRYCLVIGLVFSIVGCGSGGGGGGDTKDDIKIEPITYSGLTTPAEISPLLLGKVLNSIFGTSFNPLASATGLTQNSAGVASKPDTGTAQFKTGAPKQQKIDINETENCPVSGTLKITGTLSDAGLGTLVYDYKNCDDGYTTTNGDTTQKITKFDLLRAEPTQSTSTINRLEIISTEENYIISGTIKSDAINANDVNERLTFNASILDIKNNKSFKLEKFIIDNGGFSVNIVESISGRLFIDDIGYIDITTPTSLKYTTDTEIIPYSGVIRVLAKDNQTIELDFSNLEVAVSEAGTVKTFYLLPSELESPLTLSLADNDGDGIHASIENFYELSDNVSNLTTNADGDLFTDIEEYQQGSDINNALSPQPPEVDFTYEFTPKNSNLGFIEIDSMLHYAMDLGEEKLFFLDLNFDSRSTEKNLNKVVVKFEIPQGFEITALTSKYGSCVADLATCTMNQKISEFDYAADLTLKATSDIALGPHKIKANFSGFFAPQKEIKNSGKNIMVGISIRQYENQLNLKKDDNEENQDYINEVTLKPSIYFGDLYIVRKAKLQGNNGQKMSALYLTKNSAGITVNSQSFEMSGFYIHGGENKISANSTRTKIKDIYLHNNKYKDIKIECQQGTLALSHSRFNNVNINNDKCSEIEIFNSIVENELTASGQTNKIDLNRARINLYNNLFLNNTIFNSNTAKITRFRNNIFVNPKDTLVINFTNGGQPEIGMKNNIFIGSDRILFRSVNETQLDAASVASNIFIETMPEEYYLSPPQIGSPFIDAGSTEVENKFDLLGNPRPTDGDNDGTALPDIGPFEYQPAL